MRHLAGAYSNEFDVICDMWIWIEKDGKYYGGFIFNDGEEWYIKDRGKRINVGENYERAFVPIKDRYPIRGADDMNFIL